MSNEALVLMIRDRHIEVPISLEEFTSLYSTVLSDINVFEEHGCDPPEILIGLREKLRSLHRAIWDQAEEK